MSGDAASAGSILYLPQAQNLPVDRQAGSDLAELASAGEHRSALSISVQIGGVQRYTSHWSVSGFVLDEPISILRQHDVVNANVAVRVGDFDISFEIPAQVDKAMESGATEFRFLGAFTEQARLLHRLTEDQKAGHLTRVDAVLASPPGRSPRHGKITAGLVLGSLGIVAITLAGTVATSLLTVRSQMGAVAIDGTVLRTPATAVIAGDLIQPGALVSKGQHLFQAITPALTVQAASTSADLRRLQVLLDRTRARFSDMKHVAKAAQKLTQQKLEALNTKIGSLDAQISIYTKIVDGKQALLNREVGTAYALNAERLNLEGRRQLRQTAAQELAAARAEEELLKSGILSADWNQGTDTVASMQTRIAEMEAFVAKGRRVLDAISEASTIVSPCDCIVHARLAQVGEVLQAGMPVYSLRSIQSKPVVEALFAASDIVGVTLGTTVSVALVSGRVTGRLERFSFDDQPDMRVGLSSPARSTMAGSTTAPQMVRATISLPDNVAMYLISTPAEVAAPSDPTRRILNRISAFGASL